MAEQLPIVSHQWSADLGATWIDCDEWSAKHQAKFAGVTTRALTPLAPAHSALDELRREVEALRADRDRLACELGLAHRAITNALTLKRLDDPTIDTARASTDEGWGPVLHPKGNSDDN